jgi:uncharacterized protein YqgC (DUF456 family)
MTAAVAVVGWVVFGIAILAGLLLDVVGLFGNWVILAAIGAVWAVTGFAHFGGWAMLVMLILAVLGEAIEMVAASLGASKFGGSRGAAVAAMLGCIAGAIVGTPMLPVLGTIAGACVGAFLAAAVFETAFMRRNLGGAVRTGFGAALGKIAGLLAKMLVGFFILFVAAFTY